MDEHPLPPATQNEIDRIDFVIAKRRQRWFRMHATTEPPLHFGRMGFRFDSLKGRFGVLYVAEKPDGAFVETFGRMLGIKLVTQKKFESKSLAVLESSDLALIDITGKGASTAGVDGRLCTATNYDGLTRPWADAFHRHHIHADGILFRARHDLDQIVAAVFERARAKIRVVESFDMSRKNGKTFIMPVVNHYSFGIIPDLRRSKRR